MHSRKGLLPTHKPMTLPENQTVELKFDIDHQNWAERLLVGENRLLEMIAKGNSLTVILDGLCRLVDRVSVALWQAWRCAVPKAVAIQQQNRSESIAGNLLAG